MKSYTTGPFILANRNGVAPFHGEPKCFWCCPDPCKLDRVFVVMEIKER